MSRSRLDPSMEDLPVEVMPDILSRLPVKTIIQCKCVCKKWGKIVSDSYFADLQLSRSPAGFMMLQNLKLKYHDYEEDEPGHHHLHRDPVTSLDLNLAPIFQNSVISLVGSVNGLLCLWQSSQGNDNTFICNPITREYMILPRQQYYSGTIFITRKQYLNGTSKTTVYSFGFGPVTREYKVIRIFQKCIQQPNRFTREAEVYTLGTGKWRSLGQPPYLLGGFNGVFLNGHAHWIVLDKSSPENICAFDFDNETFELFPSPPSEATTDRSRIYKSLGVLKGCLCLCESYDNKVTVWVMKEYGIKKSWHEEFVIEESISPYIHWSEKQLMHMVDSFKDGNILMASYGETQILFVYCPQTNAILDTQVFDPRFRGYAYRPSIHRLQNFENERVDVF